MPEVTANVEATETAAPKAKKVKKAVKPAAKPGKADKKSAKVEKKPVKATKVKAERGPRVSSKEICDKVLKFLAKQSKPVKRAALNTAVGKDEGTGKIVRTVLRAGGLVKVEAAKFHDMGKGLVFLITPKGKAAASKIK